MTECQLNTFNHVILIYAEHSVRRSPVAEKTRVTFFLISCATCLWDAVGNFLRYLKTSQACALAGCSGHSRSNKACSSFIYFK